MFQGQTTMSKKVCLGRGQSKDNPELRRNAGVRLHRSSLTSAPSPATTDSRWLGDAKGFAKHIHWWFRPWLSWPFWDMTAIHPSDACPWSKLQGQGPSSSAAKALGAKMTRRWPSQATHEPSSCSTRIARSNRFVSSTATHTASNQPLTRQVTFLLILSKVI